MQFCDKCGAKLSDDAKFCAQCGVKLKVEELGLQTNEENAGATDSETSIDNEAKSGDDTSDDIEELDLTGLDANTVKSKEQPVTINTNEDDKQPQKQKHNDNIIDINEILESEKKVEMDDSIKREVLADDEVLSKICPMCGEEMQLNKQLLENTPVIVKCLHCGNETKIW
jgi:predicted RNA-binding Zn-ribbon protein involved in translation (DUF1610 family)